MNRPNGSRFGGWSNHNSTHSRQSDAGTVLLLILGFAVVVLMLVVGVLDVSYAYVAQRSLSSDADAAALEAAQTVRLAGFYAGSGDGALPLDPDAVAAAVERYEARYAEAGQRGRYAGPVDFVGEVLEDSDGEYVRVTATASYRLPVPLPRMSTADIVVSANARAPIR